MTVPDQGASPPRLLVIGLHTAGSGLTGVGLSLAEALKGPFEVGYLGLERPDGRQRCTTWPVLEFCTGLMAHGPRFSVNPRALLATLDAFDPDHVLVIGPPFLARPLLHALQPHRPRRRVALYASVEADLTDPIVLDVIQGVDTVMTYSAFTERSLRGLAQRLSRTATLPSVVTVGHGIAAPHRFHPLGRHDPGVRRALRQRAFPSLPALHGDVFVVLNANRAYTRKRHDLSIEGFAGFLRRTDAPAHLYLHALWVSPEEREALLAVAGRAGVADRVHLIPPACGERPLDDDGLNALYNATDVGLNTAMGEGWGLASFEHALTGAAQVVPDHTGLHAWTGAAQMVPTVGTLPVFYEYGTMAPVDAEGVAHALTGLYTDRALRDRLGRAGQRFAQDPRHTWEHVAQRMVLALTG